MTDALREKISNLPETPGVYKYYNSEGTIIYVGKAKNLKRRVSSYFNREHNVRRTQILVSKIADMQYHVVGTEEDALHLENSLIKEHQPFYNVLLKDDKSYPWICVTNEDYPRVFVTREKAHRGAKFYGPYANSSMATTVIQLIRKLFPIRTCLHPITADSIAKGKHKICLEYHLKLCEGCCQGFVSRETYQSYIDDIKRILNGDTQRLTQYLVEQMQACAAELRFEQAQEYKDKHDLIERYRARTSIVSPTIHNVDVYSLVRDEGRAYINYMHVRSGSIVKVFTLDYKVTLDESDAELMSLAVAEIRHRFGEETADVREAITQVIPDTEFAGLRFIMPQKGERAHLLDVSRKNVEQYKIDRIQQREKLNTDQKTIRLLTTMQEDFRLSQLPRHIECFDNSNIQGTNPVASCVVFRNGKPCKRDYRHFKIQSVVGPDDFASMKEVLTRRYSRLVEEGEDLPQLVIVDGGKGQLSAAVEAFDAMGLRGKIALAGIAKRLEEIYFPGDSAPLYIKKTSETLRVVQHLRDEAHRFGITFHRSLRSKGQVKSALDNIAGVGEKTRTALLRAFKSVKRIREASQEELAAVVGAAKAKLIKENL